MNQRPLTRPNRWLSSGADYYSSVAVLERTAKQEREAAP